MPNKTDWLSYKRFTNSKNTYTTTKFIDKCERVEVERRFSLAKRNCNLGLVTARLKDTAYHCIAMSIVVLNIRKLMLSLRDIIEFWFGWFNFGKYALADIIY